ncbi:MAG TPA: acetate/propionate family kinase [Candidatus Eremiobacteraceae bacterium]|nr:acetate/propionate family kinase [Candidatus Eremiobacteraceae bacterium]
MALDPLADVRILCLNSGSSSLKYAIYEMPAEQLLGSGEEDITSARDQPAALRSVLDSVKRQGLQLDAIGHRVVFGGPEHMEPQRVDSELIASLERLVEFDPTHTAALTAMRYVAAHVPEVPAVACFDSAFHKDMPAVAQSYPLPSDLGPMVRRFGYHGLSYEYVVSAIPPLERTLIAHLGNGASLAAIRNGRSIDTTMGFSPLGGVMMGTRPGDLDPGVLIYLLRAKRLDAEALSELLNSRSGLLGVSGTADMRELLRRAAGDRAAQDAISLYVYIAVKHIGALVAVLGGLDQFVFTGGIGEHAAPIRKAICAGCAYLGVVIDDQLNDANAACISAASSRVAVLVVATNEDLMIARHVSALLSAERPTQRR